MRSRRTMCWTACALLALAWSAGCVKHYRIYDPVSRKDYYTTQTRRDGSALVFTDGRTGAEVTLQNSEIHEITKEQYDAGRFTQPADEP